MKTLFSFSGILLLLLLNNIYAQTLSLVCEKEIFDIDFSQAKQLNFQYSGGKVIGSYIGIPIIEEIDKILKHKSIDAKTTSLLISFENNKSARYYTYFDFSNDITAISPYLITQQKVKFKMGDTIQYQTQGGKQTTDMDLSELTEHAFSVIVTNVKLQFKSMDITTQQNIFSKTSLIFPIDKSANRWFADVKWIKIYKIEK
jgi:hypothetical protein